MRDAAAHLAGADHSDSLNIRRHEITRSVLELRFYAEPAGVTTGEQSKTVMLSA
jgi:hypothetical protein